MGKYCFILFAILCLCDIRIAKDIELHPYSNGGVMLISTIDGYITAVDAKTGIEKWKFKEAPVLESPVEIQQGFTFIPNPSNGQLYFLMEGRLSKLPFTIPELVRVSPCRSSDGILYAGNKKDIWISINPDTGERTEAFSSPASNSFCPVSHASNVFVGKTEYHISMLDTRSRNRQWNATFVDYTSHLLPADVNYPYQHYTSSADGWLVTVDVTTGDILWKRKFDSVIVNMYLMKKDGMHKLPSTAIGRETFESMLDDADSSNWKENLLENSAEAKHLYPTLFVGQSTEVGLYALSAFVDSKTTIAPKYVGPPLLEGPSPIKSEASEILSKTPSQTLNELIRARKIVDGEYLLLGYHEPPPVYTNKLMTVPSQVPAAMALLERIKGQGRYPLIDYDPESSSDDQSIRMCVGNRCLKSPKKWEEKTNVVISAKHSISLPKIEDDEWTFEIIMQQIWRKYPYHLLSMLTAIFALVFTTVWLCGRHSALIRANSSQITWHDVSQNSQSSRGSRKSWFSAIFDSRSVINEQLTDISEEVKIIGKLCYDRNAKLGQGAAGTSVYAGIFDSRKVAVKRVMLDNFDMVEREIQLLRESDHHPNVIRYFCSETDNDFGYIALELCEASLDDYVKIPQVRERYPQLSKLDILKQATDGIAHLHSLSIVHRDVKPRNILLLTRSGKVHVVISDFGLCKAIQVGHNSISKTGIVGTEGWIAPEMINRDSQTCAVDIFSLGCVFYYVLSDGQHPFGDSFRQERISQGEHPSLQRLTENSTVKSLIEDMLNPEATLRPFALVVAMHPLFWSKERQLQFFMNVSDRIEKEVETARPVQRLEQNYSLIVGRSWITQLSEPLQKDLCTFRSYKSYSVRDLLRAMRNKRHHYQELSAELKESLGSIPDGYVTYFTSIFPRLLMHSYAAMTVCADESVFLNFYPMEIKEFYARKFEEEATYLAARPPGFSPRIARKLDTTTTVEFMRVGMRNTWNKIDEIQYKPERNMDDEDNWRSKPARTVIISNLNKSMVASKVTTAIPDILNKGTVESKIMLNKAIAMSTKDSTAVATDTLATPKLFATEDLRNDLFVTNSTCEDSASSLRIVEQATTNLITNELLMAEDNGSGPRSPSLSQKSKSKTKKRKRRKSTRAPFSVLSEIEEFTTGDNDEDADSGDECADEKITSN